MALRQCAAASFASGSLSGEVLYEKDTSTPDIMVKLLLGNFSVIWLNPVSTQMACVAMDDMAL